MAFNWRAFARFVHAIFWQSKSTPFRLTFKRFVWGTLFLTLFPPFELLIWTSFLLDELFFGAYSQQEIWQPIFILGNPRSGTTFLQRLLALDERNCLSMDAWEILLAPSVTLRKMGRALWSLDRWLGGLLHRQVAAWEQQWEGRNATHEFALRLPEEDQFILAHMWSGLTIWLNSAMLREAGPWTYFDTRMPKEDREQSMAFYKRCIQRHLYAHAEDRKQPRHYLAKSPSFSPKIGTLYEHFADARIIYLVRNPLDVIPSYINLLEFTWRLMGDPPEPYMSRDYVLDMARHWYTFPLQRLEQAPAESYIIVRYDDLVADPEQTVARIYQHFGMAVGPGFAAALQREAERSRRYRSKHAYCLEEMGLTREQIVTQFRDVFERFEFDMRRE